MGVRYICINVKYMYISAFGHIIDYSEYISDIYNNIVVSHAHEVIGI